MPADDVGVKQAAEYLRYTSHSVRRALNQGRLKGEKDAKRAIPEL